MASKSRWYILNYITARKKSTIAFSRQPGNSLGEFLPDGALPEPWDGTLEDSFAPYETRDAFELADILYRENQTLQKQIDRLLQIWAITLIDVGGNPQFSCMTRSMRRSMATYYYSLFLYSAYLKKAINVRSSKEQLKQVIIQEQKDGAVETGLEHGYDNTRCATEDIAKDVDETDTLIENATNAAAVVNTAAGMDPISLLHRSCDFHTTSVGLLQ